MYALLKERDALRARQAPLVTCQLASGVAAPQPPTTAATAKPFTAADAARLLEVRAELKTLISQYDRTGYQYTGAVYREIAMENRCVELLENVHC
jgi:aminopeptidase N